MSSHVASETPRQKLRRVVLRTQRSALAQDADGDSDESDGNANEYAEGLGCADGRRCRMRPESSCEFDNHPKEEYFEEPKSADQHCRCIELPVSSSSRELKAVLSQLQAQEEAEELRKPKRRRMEQAECGQAAVRFAPATLQEKRPSPLQQEQMVLAQIRTYCACLSVMRSRIERASAQPGLFEELQNDIQKDCEEALKTMVSLGLLQIGAAELKATGIGRELSRPAWQMHPSKDVSAHSQSLVPN